MPRVFLSLVALTALFGVAAYAGGTYFGSWEPPVAPRAPAETETEAEEAEKEEERGEVADEEEPPVTAEKRRWLAQVERLCRQAGADTAALSADPPTTRKQAIAFLTDVVRLNERTNDRFAALEPPAPDRRTFDRLLGTLEREEKAMRALLAALSAGDEAALLESEERLGGILAEERAALANLGIEGCGADGLEAGVY